MDFVPVAVASAFVYTLVNLAKWARARDWSSVVTQLTAWVGGVLIAWVLSQSSFGEAVGQSIGLDGPANLFDIVLIGLAFGAGASVIADGRKAIDRTDSAVTPNLLSGKVEPAPGYPSDDAPY